MKAVLLVVAFLILLIFPFACQAQQTTYATNDSLFLVSYAGYADGKYILSIKNNLTCTEHVLINYNGGAIDTVVQVAGKAETPIIIAAPYKSGSQIKVRTPDKCGGKNYELTVFYMPSLIALPLREPELAGPTSKPKKVYPVEVYNFWSLSLLKTYGTDFKDVLSKLPPGEYIIRMNNQTAKFKML